jgi:hypothetical protein
VVRGIGDEHVAVVVERHAGRILQVGLGGRTAIAQERGDAVAGDRRDRPVRGDPTDPVVERVGDEDVASMIDRDPDRIVQLCVDGRATVLRKREALRDMPGDARTGNGRDRAVRDASHSVARVDDEDAPRCVGRDTGGPIELRERRRAAIAQVPCDTASGDQADRRLQERGGGRARGASPNRCRVRLFDGHPVTPLVAAGLIPVPA